MDETPKKILIIEDEKSLSRALELKLVHEGFSVKALYSGEGFLETVKSENFSLIICDLIMPKVDGFEVLQMVKDNNINIPVIILTNLSQPEDEKRVRDLGATHFLIKSDTPLMKIIETIKTLV
jgi:DNA-binding response OmpR family regulator